MANPENKHDSASVLAAATTCLVKAGVEHAAYEARLLLALHLQCRVEDLLSNQNLPSEVLEGFQSKIDQRAQGKPFSRISRIREFWSLPFTLNDATLDPRPDSETLVESALNFLEPGQPATILDLGTGSGCLLLALLHERPQTKGIGIDRSLDACKQAQANAIALDLDHRADIVCGDWGQCITGNFDIIVANPPYIPTQSIATLDPAVRDYDPPAALDGGASGLNHYQRILTDLTRVLKGACFVEIGINQAEDIQTLLPAELIVQAKHNDLSGRVRCLEIRLKPESV